MKIGIDGMRKAQVLVAGHFFTHYCGLTAGNKGCSLLDVQTS